MCPVPARRRVSSASGAAAPGSGWTVNASSASRAPSAGVRPATTRWIAPMWGGKAAESTSSARPASHGPSAQRRQLQRPDQSALKDQPGRQALLVHVQGRLGVGDQDAFGLPVPQQAGRIAVGGPGTSCTGPAVGQGCAGRTGRAGAG